MKPTLKSKTEELFTISKIKIEKEISGLIGARSKTKLFTTDLKVLLNWAE